MYSSWGRHVEGVVQQAQMSPKKIREGVWEREKRRFWHKIVGWESDGLSGGSVVLIIDPKQAAEWEQRPLKYSLKPVLSSSCEKAIERGVEREEREDTVRSNERRLAF